MLLEVCSWLGPCSCEAVLCECMLACLGSACAMSNTGFHMQFGRDWEFSWLARNLTPLKGQKIHWVSEPGSGSMPGERPLQFLLLFHNPSFVQWEPPMSLCHDLKSSTDCSMLGVRPPISNISPKVVVCNQSLSSLCVVIKSSTCSMPRWWAQFDALTYLLYFIFWITPTKWRHAPVAYFIYKISLLLYLSVITCCTQCSVYLILTHLIALVCVCTGIEIANRGQIRFVKRGPQLTGITLTISYEVPDILVSHASTPLIQNKILSFNLKIYA